MTICTKQYIYKFIALVLSTIGIAICALIGTKIYYYLFLSAFCAFILISSFIDFKYHPHYMRSLLVIIIVCLLIELLYILSLKYNFYEQLTDFESMKQFILNTKQWGIIVFVALTIFQVVVLPIPAAVTILLGVAIYGAWSSFALSTVGTILGSLISFFLGKTFGRKLISWMAGEETTDKYAMLINNKGKFVLILMLLFPGFPDDLLCMVAGMTAMTYRYFTVICVLTRPVMIALTCFMGSGSLIGFDGIGLPIWIAIFCLILVLFVIINTNKQQLIKLFSKKNKSGTNA